MNTLLSRASVVIALLVATGAALAHHSFAMFDQTKTLALKGAVKELRWTNPHVFIQVLVKNDQGAESEWSIEMTSPEHLSRTGWRPGTLKPGDQVTLNIHPLVDGDNGGQYLSGTGPTGPLIGSAPPARPEPRK
ncbi:MAG: DUF6152 family protein [Gammaproteobacteria bacterium]